MRNTEAYMCQKILSILLIATALTFTGCYDDSSSPVDSTIVVGSGDLVTVQRSLASFQSVDLTTVGSVNISSGSTQLASITVDDNVAGHILTRVNNGVLTISADSAVSLSGFNLTVDLTMTDLRSLQLEGVGNITILNQFNVDSVSLSLSGVGNIACRINGDYLHSSNSGVGNIVLMGSADYHLLQHSAVGSVNAFDMNTDTTTATLSGAGSAEVYVSDSLDVTISGAGSLFYKGSPTITQRLSGTGQIIDAN